MGQEFIMPEEMLYDAKRINEIERKEKEKAERDQIAFKQSQGYQQAAEVNQGFSNQIVTDTVMNG